jgi:hypothetical protein
MSTDCPVRVSASGDGLSLQELEKAMEGESQMILSRSSKFRALEAALRNDAKKRVQYEEFAEVMKDVRPDIPNLPHP